MFETLCDRKWPCTKKSRIAASREDWDFRWRLGANPPSPNKHSLFVFLPTPCRSLFVSPPDGCGSSISPLSDNLRNSSCPHFRPPSPGWRRERGPGGPGGGEAVDAARAEPTSAAFSRERPSGRGGTAGSEPPGALPGRESPGARPQPGGFRAEATLGEVEARGARGRAGRTGRSSAADLAGAPARPIR